MVINGKRVVIDGKRVSCDGYKPLSLSLPPEVAQVATSAYIRLNPGCTMLRFRRNVTPNEGQPDCGMISPGRTYNCQKRGHTWIWHDPHWQNLIAEPLQSELPLPKAPTDTCEQHYYGATRLFCTWEGLGKHKGNFIWQRPHRYLQTTLLWCN